MGTVTEIHDYLRLLFARAARRSAQTTTNPAIAKREPDGGCRVGHAEETKLMILAPVLRDRKGEHAELFAEMQAKGLCAVSDRRASGGGGRPQTAGQNEKHDVDVVVDRLKVRADMGQRLAKALRLP